MYVYGSNEVSGFEWFIVIVAFLADLSSLFGGSRARRTRTEY
jgi:hypothetical protein